MARIKERVAGARGQGHLGIERPLGGAKSVPPVYVGSVAVVLKPWTKRTGIIRTQDGSIPTASMPMVADMISTAAGKLPKLLGSQIRLVCLQGSGKVVANVPRAPPTPNQEVMMSTEVDSYLRAVQ